MVILYTRIYYFYNKFSFFYSIISRSSGYGNDAVSPPILVSIVASIGIGHKQSEVIVLEVSETNNLLAVEEVYIEGIPFQRLKQVLSPKFKNSSSIQNSEEESPKILFKICRLDVTC